MPWRDPSTAPTLWLPHVHHHVLSVMFVLHFAKSFLSALAPGAGPGVRVEGGFV
jgi:hypothetical protein